MYKHCIWLGNGKRGKRYFLDENRDLQEMKSSVNMSFLAPFKKNVINDGVTRMDYKSHEDSKYHIPKTQEYRKIAKFFLNKRNTRNIPEYEYKLKIDRESENFEGEVDRLSKNFENKDSAKRFIFIENEYLNPIMSDAKSFFEEIKFEKNLKIYIIKVKYMFLGLSIENSKNPWGKYTIPLEDCEIIYEVFNQNSPKTEAENIKLYDLGRIMRDICDYMSKHKITSIGIKKENDLIHFILMWESKCDFLPISSDDYKIITGFGWDLGDQKTDYNEVRDKCEEFYGCFVTTKKFIKQYKGINNMFKNSVKPLRDPIDPNVIKEVLDDLLKRYNRVLDESQKESINPIMEGKCRTLVLTGGPGTGKSTTLLTLRKCFIKSEIPVFVLTFTGKASNRLNIEMFDESNEKGVKSMTIHRFYGKLKRLEKKIRGLLIIDEASTVSIENLYMISEVFEEGPIVMVGDPKQLPPVEQGRIFNRIIKRCDFFSDFFHSELKRNFRSEDCGDIMKVVMAIEKNDIINMNELKDVTFEKGGISKVADLYVNKREKVGMDTILILTNKNKNVEDINSIISEKLKTFYFKNNNGMLYYTYPNGGAIYKENNIKKKLVPFGVGARIMFIKNKY
jgi:hypothetical protein